MKNAALLLVLLLLLTAVSQAQTVGLKAGPNVSYPGFSAGYGFSGGVFFDQILYKKLGVATGLQLTQLRAANLPFFCLTDGDSKCPDKIDHRFDILEIPIDLTLDLTMQPAKKLRFYMTGGYAFGQIIDKTEFVYQDDKKAEQEITNLPGLISQLHFFRLGIESRYQVSNKLNVGVGTQYKYTRIYDDMYGDFNNLGFYLKAGYRFQ